MRRTRAFKPVLSLLVFAGLLLVGEGAARAVHAVTGEAWDGARMERRLLEAASAREVFVQAQGDAQRDIHDLDPRSRLVLSPYLGYDVVAALESLEEDRRWFASAESETTYDILILGGSVAGLFGWEGTGRLSELLAGAPGLEGRPVRFVHHARGGFKQPQSLAVLMWDLVLGLRPDAVLLIDGFNEVALGNQNAERGFFPLQPSIQHWARVSANTSLAPETIESLFEVHACQRTARKHAALAARLGLHRSALLGSFALALLRRDSARTAAAYEGYSSRIGGGAEDIALTGPSFEGGEARGVEIAVQGWLESSRLMHGLCASQGIAYLHVLQPTLHDQGSKPLTDEERASSAAPEPWIEGVALGYDRLRAGGATLAAEGVAFTDASRVFAEQHETLYFDACHFRARGAELLAERIAPALAAAIDR